MKKIAFQFIDDGDDNEDYVDVDGDASYWLTVGLNRTVCSSTFCLKTVVGG